MNYSAGHTDDWLGESKGGGGMQYGELERNETAGLYERNGMNGNTLAYEAEAGG